MASHVYSQRSRARVCQPLDREPLAMDHVTKRVSSCYRPMSQGLVERCNQAIQRMLLKVVKHSDQRDWDEFVEEALYCYATSRQESSRVTPFESMFLRSPLPESQKPNVEGIAETRRRIWRAAKIGSRCCFSMNDVLGAKDHKCRMRGLR
jgi:hypothetical protein